MRPSLAFLGQTVPDAQLSHSLRSLRAANAKSYDRRLTHVTSEILCDDVIRLLKPTLPPPQTCDIIDLNPGPCLWSQKLHELLKPRRHILVEPRHRLFADFIDPLLAKPNSAYRYASSTKQAFDPKERLLSEDTYHFRQNAIQDETYPYQVNADLIMTANLSGMARKITGFTGSEAKRFLNDYYRSIFVHNDYLHRYGLVRFLAWVGEDARLSIMPTSVNSRTKQSVQLEAACLLDQVAGPSQIRGLHPHQRRWHTLDMENQQDVHKQQKKLNFVVPPTRDQPDPIPSFTSLKPNMSEVRNNKDLYPYNQVYIQRLLELDDYLSTEDPEWYAEYQSSGHGRRGKGAEPTESNDQEKKREYRILINQLRTHHNTYLKASDFIFEQRQAFKQYQRRFKQGWFSTQTGLPLKSDNKVKAEKLISDDEFLQDQRKAIKLDTRSLVQKAGDDYRCYDSDMQIMAWNRRRFDPLLVQDSEFFPKVPLTLFDFRPNASLPSRLNTVDKQICFDYVCTLLMTNSGETVLQGIKRLVPAGWDQFLERVPELRDPSKGGWWNLDHVRIRALHHDQFITLALVFHDWPHRPEIEKLMAIYKGVFDEGPR